ncbi:MAG: EAL domain-containing protein [Myxacorys chilensis ATA2-1-KO14]|jgi:diguanylate cyclase (GGDEF)-like protein|nr:EAL domain-containing protein [Myxacorys chilensis ATA2-1-KO14]
MPRSENPRSVPLQLLLVVPFVLQIFTVIGLVSYLSFQNGQKSVSSLADRLRQEVSARIAQHLTGYMEIPKQLTSLNANAIKTGIVNSENPEALEQFFWGQVNSFNAGFVLYGSGSGNFESAGFVYDDRATIGYVNPAKHGNSNLYIWEADRLGRRTTKLVGDFGAYPFQQEDWYRAAIQQKRLTWTSVYNWQAAPFSLAISASLPIYDANQQLKGVVASEQRLSQISDFLRQLTVSPSGKTFIIERTGLMIGSSVPEQPFKIVDGEPQRLKASDSKDLLIRATAQHLNNRFGNLNQIQHSQQLDFSLDHQPQFVQVTPWKDDLGIDWLVVVVVPESDFMAQIYANTRTTIWLCLLALALAIVLAFHTSRWITYPILRLSQASQAISDGDLNQQVEASGTRELAALARSFNGMTQQLRESFAKLEHNAHHDALTDLPNRTAFQLKLQEAISHAADSVNHDSPYLFAILFLDIDYFKLINDSLGHLAGDQLLIEVGKRLSTSVRATQILNQSLYTTLARFGGDEFIILVDNITDITDAIKLADRISQELQQPFTLKENELFISTSIGIVLSTMGDYQPESFLRNADIALYWAKFNGKARYEIFDSQMYTEVVERLQIETDLRRAIEREEFEVYYQPIVDLKTHQTTGFEALVRWYHPTQGMVSPDRFIPVAEETGIIVSLDWWVLRQACQQMRLWQQQFACCQFMVMSVNLSSKQFLQPDLVKQIDQILSQTGLQHHNLKLEITESLLMNQGEATQSKLTQLSNSGIRLSLDDFGTGYSSLSYLYRFPIHTLKIDRSFISRLGVTGETLEIVEAIIVLAHKLGMYVIAEGVETPEQLEQLRAICCEQAQGYLFSPPLPADRITQFLTKQASLKMLK